MVLAIGLSLASLAVDCPIDQTSPIVSVLVEGSSRIIRSDGCPGYDWLSQTSVYTPQQQSHRIVLPLSPRINTATTSISSATGVIGITLNGIPIYPPKDNAGRDALAPAYSVYGSGQLQCSAAVLTMVQAVSSASNCAVSCKQNKNCAYFTFWSTQKRCNLFASCDPLVGGGVDAQTYKIDVNEGDQNDQCAGHSSPGGVYHYRSTPGDMHALDHFSTQVGGLSYCPGLEDAMKDTTAGEHSPLIGFALDGIPIFGPLGVGGKLPDDLDECNGGTNSQYPYYHYHTSTNYPYTIGCFKGCVCDTADYADPAECPNSEFAAATCTPAVTTYDYSGLIGVAAATTTLYGQTTNTTVPAAVGVSASGGTESPGVVHVTMDSLGLPKGSTPSQYAEAWASATITAHGYEVTLDPSKGSNLVAHLEPGQSYGRILVMSGEYKTGYALGLVVNNGKVWGQFDQRTNVLWIHFAEENKYIAAKFV